MTDLVEQLRAQSKQARLTASIHSNPQLQASWDSLADLIDGTLTEHAMVFDHTDHKLYCRRCDILDPGPCPSLSLLATHVSAVLSGYTQTAREAQ